MKTTPATASEIRCAKQAAQSRGINITDTEAEKAVLQVRRNLPSGGLNDDQEFWDEMKQYFLN